MAGFVLSDAIESRASSPMSSASRLGLPVIKGVPPFAQYLRIAPFIGMLVPIAFQVQGLDRLRRGRSRVDDFFGVFVDLHGSLLGFWPQMYAETYVTVSESAKDVGLYEVSQGVWGLVPRVNVVFSMRRANWSAEALERRWRGGIRVSGVLIAGAGNSRTLPTKGLCKHPRARIQVVGFLDDKAIGDHIRPPSDPRRRPACPPLTHMGIRREHVDDPHVALPLEEHVKMLALVETTNRAGVGISLPFSGTSCNSSRRAHGSRISRRPDHQPQRRARRAASTAAEARHRCRDSALAIGRALRGVPHPEDLEGATAGAVSFDGRAFEVYSSG